jgi:hypothetical protein
MTATWRSNSSGNWVDFATNTSISTGTNITQTNANFSSYSTIYYWSVNVTDSNGGWINETYHFTTEAESVFIALNTSTFSIKASVTAVEGNTNPIQSGVAPSNGSTGIAVLPTMYVICTDNDAGNEMNATWRSNSSGTWASFGNTSSIANNTNISKSNSNFSATNTKYWWSVNLSDGHDGWDNETYHFTTRSDFTPDAPASFTASAYNKTQINVTWTDHVYSDTTRVEWNATADASWNVGDHTLLYNGTAQTTSQSGLDPSTARYYKAWSWNETDALWSVGATSDATTDANLPPSITSPSPTNSSFAQELSFTWSCTIGDDENLFNWTIECNNSQTNSANDATNGSKTLSISGLSYFSPYKVWVNATDYWGAVTNYWYTFTTKNESVFVVLDTDTFSIKAEITSSNPTVSNVYPSNSSSGIAAYPQLRITVTDPSGLDVDVAWSTNATGSWTHSNTTVASGSTIYQRATFANTSDIKYWWTVKVNNSNGEWVNETYHFTLSNYTWGEWSGWWVVYYTDCDEPLNLASQANSSSMIYLSWTLGNNSDRTHIQYDTSTYPTAISEGNLSYNDTGINHEQSGLAASTTYYFTAWSYNGTNVTMSYNSSTTSSTTNAGNTPPTQSGEAPSNASTGISVTPSLYVICTDADSDTMNATWRSNSSGNWVDFATNTSISTGTNITQINSNFSAYSTTYWWSANLSDGNSSWDNETYHFTTREDTIVFTRIFQTPSNIRMNDTTSNTSLYITYNVTTGSTGINETSLLLATIINNTMTGCLNATYKIPASEYHPDRMEAINRQCVGSGYWWESLFNDTGTKSQELGYCGQWGVRNDSLSGNFTINSQGSNWINFSFNPRMYRIPATIQMVDYFDRVKEDKTGQNLDVWSGNLVRTIFNMTDTCFYDDPLYNHSLYTLFFNYEVTGNPVNDLQVYFANDSYTTYKGDPSESPYCTLIKSFPDTDPFTYSAHNSSYHNATFSTNETGFVGTVKMDSNFSIIFRLQYGNAANGFDIPFADDNVSNNDHWHDFNQSETTEISTDGGDSWSSRNGTVDCFLNFISLDDEDQFMYKAYVQMNGTDTGDGSWSTVQTDLFDESNYPPSSPGIILPNGTATSDNYTIGDTINVTYNWLGDPNLETCWLNITVHNETHVVSYWLQNRSITDAETRINSTWYYDWDTTGTSAGTYHINVTATDPYGEEAGGRQNGTFMLRWNAPSSFSATVHNTTQINLTWSNAVGADKTVVIRNESGYAAYPISQTNGTEIYNNTGTNYEDIGLEPGTKYWYTTWTWNATEKLYSLENATDDATTNAPGEVVFSNLALSHHNRHTTSETSSPSDYINFTITATNVASIQINITDAFSVIHTESIFANKSGDNYWCNRTLPESWGNGTYSVKMFASSASLSNESSSFSFNMYPTCDVNMNNWTTATDITQVIGGNWGLNGVNRFCVEDVNGNGWVTATDITVIIDPNKWGAVTKP